MLFGPAIATDIDGVIADVEAHTRHKIYEKFGILPRPDREDKFYMHERYSNREAVQYAKSLFNDPAFIESLPTFKSNVTELKRWYDTCTVDHVYAITGRGNEVREATLRWLYQHGIPFTALITEAKNKKGMYMTSLGCDYLIEDRLDEAERVAKLGQKVYLIERPYNIGGKETSVYAKDIIWVESIRDIGKIENYYE